MSESDAYTGPPTWQLLRRYGPTLAVLAIGAFALTAGLDPGAIWREVRDVEGGLFLLAVGSYYATVPLRAHRWRRLLRGVDLSISRREANRLVLLGLFFNTVLPAKAGDLYKTQRVCDGREPTRSSVLGTVAAIRVVDVLLLGIGVLATGLVVAGEASRDLELLAGTVLVAFLLLGAGLILVVGASERLPGRVREVVAGFRDGLATALQRDEVGFLVATSMAIWSANVLRTGLVFAAMGVEIGPVRIAFVAFLLAFLTGLPYTPAGLGFVEVIGTATVAGLGIGLNESVSVVLLDRAITVVSVVLVGLVAYLLSRHLGGDPGKRVE